MTAALTRPSRPAALTSSVALAPSATVPLPTPDGSARVLVLVDDPFLRRTLDTALRTHGLSVRATTDVAAADVLARSFRPDVVVVDARQIAHRLAQHALADPQIRLVVSGADAVTRVAALRAGADDALAPDCLPVEIALRCAVLVRRTATAPTADPGQSVCRGRMVLDRGRRVLIVDGDEVPTTRLEFDLLAELCRRPAKVSSRPDLLTAVWGPGWVGDTHVVDVHLSNLRRKIRDRAPDLSPWRTVRGVGFRLDDDTTSSATTSAHA
jgi:DNA-binding response OmpR family regulator